MKTYTIEITEEQHMILIEAMGLIVNPKPDETRLLFDLCTLPDDAPNGEMISFVE